MYRLAEKWGGVFSIKMGAHECVILHDHDAIRAALKHPKASGRPSGMFQMMDIFSQGVSVVPIGCQLLVSRFLCLALTTQLSL